ncbi:MaoC family dehydratase [Profundibacterium mesophilum]|uniref:Nodulation protein N n=1 Tax=Profundibacterium mesophilum KAUST100406-0324 TaxID=1037889 RepID=A0A921NTS1_9RHOB|nr:MaoC family dehydratase [Profundibacterium mesophilum]KAF0674604.1 Nodulation protein N [Profundibacterium mesophilum KAUST100406-0324]
MTSDELAARIGEEIGLSDWMPVTQAMIDSFADATGDHQFIHVDPQQAALTEFGGTIAHGFLTLSLLAGMAGQAVPALRHTRLAVNYGFDRLRFISPVRSGARIRGRFVLAELRRGQAQVTMAWNVTVEIDHAPRPALNARWINRTYLEETD